MKALSIQQPWADLIFSAGKDYENRSWGTDYRGPLLIHAGKTWHPDSWTAPLANGRPGRWIERYERASGGRSFGVDVAVPRGALIGWVQLVGCGVAEEAGPNSLWAEPYSVNWYLQQVEGFEVPIPWRGRRGLFEVALEDLREPEPGAGQLFGERVLPAGVGQLIELLTRELRDELTRRPA